MRLARALDVPLERILRGPDGPLPRMASPRRRILRRLEQVERLPRRRQATVLQALATHVPLPLPNRAYTGCAMPRLSGPRCPALALGTALAAARRERGLTQVELAAALGATQRVISHYETRAELPPAAALVALARVLQVSSDELLGLRPPRPRPAAPAAERRLWTRFRRMASLPERDQRVVPRLISSLAGSRKSA